MTDRLLVATHNMGKLAELRELLHGVPFELVSLSDVGIEMDVDETGETLEENAELKATTYARALRPYNPCGRLRVGSGRTRRARPAFTRRDMPVRARQTPTASQSC